MKNVTSATDTLNRFKVGRKVLLINVMGPRVHAPLITNKLHTFFITLFVLD